MLRKCVWLVVGALLLPVLLSLQSHDAEAVIEPIYTLPFYDSFRISQGFIPGSHNAIDYEIALNESVSATAGGAVIHRGDANDGYGRKVVIDHGGRYTSLYGHLNGFASGIVIGAQVSQGQTIGYADATGYVIPPGAHHLHFRMQLNGAAFKPEPMSWVSGFGNFGACTGIVSPIGARY